MLALTTAWLVAALAIGASSGDQAAEPGAVGELAAAHSAPRPDTPAPVAAVKVESPLLTSVIVAGLGVAVGIGMLLRTWRTPSRAGRKAPLNGLAAGIPVRVGFRLSRHRQIARHIVRH